jgi:predicted DNA-binding protein (MmcQ/YjbR family)
MDLDSLRRLCLSFPGVTEQIQWGDDLLFKVGGKMFVITCLEPAPVYMSFKVDPQKFFELTERPGVIPAPYLARAKWVALESADAIPASELCDLLREAYELIAAKLPSKVRASLTQGNSARTAPLKPLRRGKSHKSAHKKKSRNTRKRHKR